MCGYMKNVAHVTYKELQGSHSASLDQQVQFLTQTSVTTTSINDSRKTTDRSIKKQIITVHEVTYGMGIDALDAIDSLVNNFAKC